MIIQVCLKQNRGDTDNSITCRYPHLACELLTSEVFTIVEQLSTSENLLNMLWDFLDSSDSLNPLLASFVSKVLSMLLAKEPNVVRGLWSLWSNFGAKHYQVW